MNLPAKDPSESVVIEFDFSSELATLTEATVTVAVVSGTDATPALILEGARQIQGNKVLQRVHGGLDRVSYKITCEAVNGLDIRVLSCVLPVREA